jgi:hypothetical protein
LERSNPGCYDALNSDPIREIIWQVNTVSDHPLDPRLVHRLPPAPHFVGREPELDELRRLWRSGFHGVAALVGLGGAGKTAVAARFLDDLLALTATPKPAGLLVWSFYQEPDAGLFLQEAFQYFGGGGRVAAAFAKGTGLLHLLREALSTGDPYLLVLDGLERVQRQGQSGAGDYGQVEDPLLKGLLARIAAGLGRTAALVTSRFPLTDLHAFRERGYRQLDVGGLGQSAALALLRSHGVQGDDAALTELIDTYGAHALTVDHLGGLIGQCLGGDPARAPEAPSLAAPGGDRQALRLARLLRAYEEHLPPAELALLCRLCLLRRSVSAKELVQLFLCSPAVHAHTVRELGPQILHLPGSDKYLEQDLLLDLSQVIPATIEEALCAAQIAGPEEVFREEVLSAAEGVVQLEKKQVTLEIAELTRLYGDPALDVPTDERPLSAEDRAWLRERCARYVELYNHPLLPFRDPVPLLEGAFQARGWEHPAAKAAADTSAHSVMMTFLKVKRQLNYLVGKHFALRRVRELCRFYQRKWTLAGPLAPLDATEMRGVFDALVGRHLLLRESDGSFSVHPAVRDHFYQLAKAAEQGTWHDILREQMVSLIRQPGRRHPEDQATLYLAEEAIYHALQTGRRDEAEWLYANVLGGLRHLAWKLGEMARGLRILRGFEPCPDRWALAWFLRALGEFEEAYHQNDMPYFRADILLLQGRLPAVAGEKDSTRTPVADFLMGKTTTLPPDQLGCAIPREQFLLYLGRLHRVRASALLERFYGDIGWEGDRARCQLLLAEVARRQADAAQCRKYLDAASGWILHSGSVEHLCLLHLMRARAARSAGDHQNAQWALDEGLHTARQCGLGLYHVDLLCEQAEVSLVRGDAVTAEQAAREALRRASAADCQFRWGAAQAGHLLGQTLIAQQRFRDARPILKKALVLRRRIGDPGAEQTEQLKNLLGG